MQGAPPLLEQRLIGDLLSQGVLEGILDVGKEARLVEELGGLQMGESQTERRLRRLGNGLEERQRHLGADDGGGLQELFLLRWQPVDTRRQDRLDRRGHLQALEGVAETIGTWLPDQHAGLDQGAHALLQKEGIAPGPDDVELCERY